MPASPEYLRGVRRLCDEREALLIVDEVQTRARAHGQVVRRSSTPGVAPDIVTMAKALGNGVPIGACWARADVAAAFAPGDHATTFGGQPLAARAALAVLDVMEREQTSRSAPRAPARGSPEALARRSTASPTCAARACSIAAELAPGSTPRTSRSGASTRGLVRERGDADRAAARAVAARHRRRDRRSRRDRRGGAAQAERGMNFLEVDDLDPARLGARARPRDRVEGRSRRGPGRARGAGRRGAVREAVGAHADLDRDGGRDARRSPDLHPRRRGRSRHARVGRGRRPHDGRHVRGDRGARLRPPHARAHGRGRSTSRS